MIWLVAFAVTDVTPETWEDDLAVILSIVVAATAVIGVCYSFLGRIYRSIDELRQAVDAIEAWRAPWATMPEGMNDATTLTRTLDEHSRALTDHGHKLEALEDHLTRIDARLAEWE